MTFRLPMIQFHLEISVLSKPEDELKPSLYKESYHSARLPTTLQTKKELWEMAEFSKKLTAVSITRNCQNRVMSFASIQLAHVQFGCRRAGWEAGRTRAGPTHPQLLESK